MDKQTILFYGSSGSGKGTQAELLVNYLQKHDSSRSVELIETGKLLRSFTEMGSYTAKLTDDIIDAGGLLPEFLPIWIWTSYFVRNFEGNEHLILDGVARRLNEAPVLDSAFAFYNRSPRHVIYLKVSPEVVVERLTGRGRVDDTVEGIRERQEWFEENTLPAIEYFKDNSDYTFVEIDGDGTVEEIHADIIKALSI